jgi:hypothetical protein
MQPAAPSTSAADGPRQRRRGSGLPARSPLPTLLLETTATPARRLLQSGALSPLPRQTAPKMMTTPACSTACSPLPADDEDGGGGTRSLPACSPAPVPSSVLTPAGDVKDNSDNVNAAGVQPRALVSPAGTPKMIMMIAVRRHSACSLAQFGDTCRRRPRQGRSA